MRPLIALMLVAVVVGMFSRSFDWRGYCSFLGLAVIVAGVYHYSSGVW